MAFLNIFEIKQEAIRRLERNSNATRLIALHSGIPAIISLALTLISYLLSRQIEGTGGLGGMGLRSTLEAVQQFLQLGSTAFSVFWAMGIVQITLCWAQGREAGPSDLLAGFRHWGVVLRAALLKGCLFLGGAILAGQISSIVFSMTPWFEGADVMIEQILTDPNYIPPEGELMSVALRYMPFLIGALAIFLIPLFYRLRMMDYVIMTHPEAGAAFALRMSRVLMRRNCFKLLRLDLSFWWFYLLEVVTALVFYGDLVVQLAGIDLGVSGDLLLFVCCAAGLALQFGLYVWRQGRVVTTYALFYETLVARLEEQAARQQRDA